MTELTWKAAISPALLADATPYGTYGAVHAYAAGVLSAGAVDAVDVYASEDGGAHWRLSEHLTAAGGV
jgi:hypothetical protein